MEPSRASNHRAPTPNCQFGSRLPDRMIVLRSTSVRPSVVEANRCATWMPPPWVRPGVDHAVVGDDVVVAAVDRDAVGQDRVLHRVVVERVVDVGVLLGPGGQAVVARVADVAVGDAAVGHAVVEVDAVRGEVAQPQPAHHQVVERPVHPGADLGVLDPHPVDRRVGQRAADAVDLVGVVALLHVAEDREVGQVDVGARVRRVVAVEPDAVTGGAGVPHARALDRHVVDDDVVEDLERPDGDPDRAAGTGRGDRLRHRGRRVVHAASGRRRRWRWRPTRRAASAARPRSRSRRSRSSYDEAVASASTCSRNVVPAG